MASEQSKQRRLPESDSTSRKQAGGNGASGSLLVVDSDDSSSELDISPSADESSLLDEEKEVLLTLGRIFSLGLRDGGLVVIVLPVTRIDSNSADACDSKSALLFDNSFGREDDDENDNLGVEG